jgi:hypothetical protein
MKRRVQTEVLKQFFAGTLEKDADRSRFVIIPKDRIPNRCLHLQGNGRCIRYRIMGVFLASTSNGLTMR